MILLQLKSVTVSWEKEGSQRIGIPLRINFHVKSVAYCSRPDVGATQGQQSGLTKEHEALAQRLHEADTVMSKYYYDSVNRRTNVFICAKTEEQLHVSRVDDGICDCCDGSDEPNKAWCKSATPCLSYEDKLKRLKAWLKKDSSTNIDNVQGAMFSIRENSHTHQTNTATSEGKDRRVNPAINTLA